VRFVDTNILLYAISNDPAEGAKSDVARAILESRDLALSVQVIQEFFVQTTRSGRSDALSSQQALGLIQSFMRFPIQDIGMAVVLLAMATSREFQIPYWDAAIIEAARVMKCDIVLSEDLNHGQDYGGVRGQPVRGIVAEL
jgi:predicted nucleic acid-binding protein